MKYIALICATIAAFLGVYAYYLDSRLCYTKEKLTLAESEKNALKTEVREYNEKSLQASKQIKELKIKAEQGKKDNPSDYYCFDSIIPEPLLE